MKSDSWASYQSALPPEARSGGEPDDDPPGCIRLRDMGPDGYAVCWMADVPFQDINSGDVEWDSAPVALRTFGPLAFRWAKAYRDIMARRFPGRHVWIDDI